VLFFPFISSSSFALTGKGNCNCNAKITQPTRTSHGEKLGSNAEDERLLHLSNLQILLKRIDYKTFPLLFLLNFH